MKRNFNSNSKVPGKIIGIDLGTTNSVVAVVIGGQPTLIPSSNGNRSTPSIVAYTSDNKVYVGEIAKRQAVLNPQNTYYSTKRFIGKGSNEVKEMNCNVLYKVVLGQDNEPIKFECPALNRKISPEEISAEILKKLVFDAQVFLGEPIKAVVITVPAYFNESQRQATNDAAKIAGLKVDRILNEPTSAAMYYGLDKKTKQEKALVFDLGGGTFDVSVMDVDNAVLEVKATSGNTNLGGDNFDERIIAWLKEELKIKHSADVSKDQRALQRINSKAESVKIELSGVEEVEINFPFITNDIPSFDTILTRDTFEKMCSDLLKGCIGPVRTALNDCSLEPKGIDTLLLVGGSTRIPAVKNIISDLLKKEPTPAENPDEAVAFGAAIQGAISNDELRGIILVDVTPLSLGIETVNDTVQLIIPKNTAIPHTATETFTTPSNRQTIVDVNIIQGERPIASKNKTLGQLVLDDIRPAPAGTARIEVSFSLNKNGILNVQTIDLESNKNQSITINQASNLTDEEIAQIIDNAEKNSAFDTVWNIRTSLINYVTLQCDLGITFITNEQSFLSIQLKGKLEKCIIHGISLLKKLLPYIKNPENCGLFDLKRTFEELRKIGKELSFLLTLVVNILNF